MTMCCGEKRYHIRHYVKPLMFVCPLFRKPNKTAKLKGANINCRPKNRTKLLQYFELYGFNSPNLKIKGARIILHSKSPTFRAAKLKGFTLSNNPSMSLKFCTGATIPCNTQYAISSLVYHRT